MDQRQGVDNPYFRSQILAGVNAGTSFTASKQRIVRKGFGSARVVRLWTIPCGITGNYYSGDILGIPTLHYGSLPSASLALNRALSDFAHTAAGEITPFLGGAYVGELRKSLKMILSPAKTLRQSLDSYLATLKKGKQRIRDRNARRRFLEDTYLEAVFGWQPLIKESQAGLHSLNRIRPSSILRISGRGRDQTSGTSPAQVFASGFVRITYVYQTTRTASTKITGGVKVQGLYTGAGYREEFGFDLASFVPSAYELMPWSFFIDYFTNIGTVIEAASQVQANLAWCSQTTRTTYETQVADSRLDIGYAKTFGTITEASYNPTRHRLITTSISRTPLSSIVPGLVFRLPGFGSVTSLNIAALASAMQHRRTPYY